MPTQAGTTSYGGHVVQVRPAVAPPQRSGSSNRSSSGSGFTWSGKVEESGGGQPEATTYYYQGQQIAKVYHGGGGTYTGGSRGTYFLTFPKGETVEIKPSQISITQYPQLIQTSQSKALQEQASYMTANIQQAQPTVMTSATTLGGILTQQETYNIPFWTKVGMSFGAAKKVETIGTMGFGKYVSNIFAPWERTKVRPEIARELTRSEKYIPQGTAFDTNIGKQVFGQSFDVSKMTAGEARVLADIKSGVSPSLVGLPTNVQVLRISEAAAAEAQRKIQARIDTGELAYGTEEEKAHVMELARKQYQDELTKWESQYEKMSRARELYGSATYQSNPLKTGAKIGFIGATAALTSPAIVGYEAALLSSSTLGGYMIGSSAPKIITAFNPNLTLKERVFSGVSGGLSVSGGAYFASYAIGPTQSSLLSRWNVRDLIKDLEIQPIKITGKELYASEKGSYFKILGERSIGSAKQEINYRLAVFRNVRPDVIKLSESNLPVVIEKGGETYPFVLKGGTSKVTVYDFVSDKIISSIEKIPASGRIVAFGEGMRLFRPLQEGKIGMEFKGVTTGSGSLYLRIPGKEGFKTFKLFGGSKDLGKSYSVFGASPTKVIFSDGKIIVRGRVTSYGEIIKQPIFNEEELKTIIGKKGLSDLSSMKQSAWISNIQSTIQSQKYKTSPTVLIGPVTSEIGKQQVASISASLIEKASAESLSLSGTIASVNLLGLQEKQKQLLVQSPAMNFKQAQRSILATAETEATAAGQRTASNTIFGLGTGQAQLSEQIPQRSPQFQFPTIPITPAPTIPPEFKFDPSLLFPKLKKFGFEEALKSGKIRIRKLRRYVPSVEALFKKIRGKKPKSPITLAIGTRPIPKGFKWYKGGI